MWGRPLADGLWFVALAISGVIGIASLIVRRHRGRPEERAQLRWFLSAAIVSAAMFLLLGLDPETDSAAGPLSILWGLVVSAGLFWSLPVAVVIAVLRYRLYEIDRIISRTVTYAVVVGLLGGVVAVLVSVSTLWLPGESDLAVAGSTLAVAACSTRCGGASSGGWTEGSTGHDMTRKRWPMSSRGVCGMSWIRVASRRAG
jgi:hypothetical protein